MRLSTKILVIILLILIYPIALGIGLVLAPFLLASWFIDFYKMEQRISENKLNNLIKD